MQCGRFYVAVTSSFSLSVSDDDTRWQVIGFSPMLDSVRPVFVVSLDKRKHILSLQRATDFGLPFFFHISAVGDFIASTHLHLLRQVGVPLTEDPAALPEFFLYRCVMPPQTLFKDVQRIHHGGRLNISLSGERSTVVRHAPASFLQGDGPSRSTAPFDRQVLTLVDHLKSSITSVNGGADSTASLMSGGIDSAMTAVLAKAQLGVQQTHSTAYPFELPSLDMERAYADSAALALGFQHKHYVGSCRGYRRALIMATALAEEPVHHLQSACMHMLFTEGMDSGIRSIIQGLGAGGVFGNFRNHLYLLDKIPCRVLALEPFRSGVGLFSRMTGRGSYLHEKLSAMANHAPIDSVQNPIWDWHRYGSREWVDRRFGDIVASVVQRQYAEIERTNPTSIYDYWARYSLLGDEDATLAINSKIAAGSGIWLHSPLYSAELLEAVLSMSWEEKMRHPENRLRKAMAAAVGVPAFIWNRKKTGFGIKRRDWAMEGGVFAPFDDLLKGVLDIDEIKAARLPQPAMAMTFWCLLTYGLWKRLVIRQDPVEMLISELDEAELRFNMHD